MAKTAAQLVEEARARVESVTVDELAGERRSDDVVVLDVREPEEWEAGHIPGAVHIPRGELEFKADPASPYYQGQVSPAQRIVVHCAAGLRSVLATATLKDLGYERAANLEGGYKAWAQAGQPVERGRAA